MESSFTERYYRLNKMIETKELNKSNTIQLEPWVPEISAAWPEKEILKVGNRNYYKDDFLKDIKSYSKKKKWVFPTNPVHFISDLHADTDAFFKSLIGAGFIKKTGIQDADFEILEKSKAGKLIIGGDCLDKGPSNLRLLDAIKLIKDAGVEVEIIAGNHDIRTYAGLAVGQDRQVVAEHMFVRMGNKTIPLFREIYKKYLHNKIDPTKLLSKEEVIKRVFPSEKWFETYAHKMQGLIPPKKIELEAKRILEKMDDINNYLERTGFTHGMLYATAEKASELFMKPGGEYEWFFKDMKLAVQEGSFLIVHAGLDDFSTDWIGQSGVDGLNEKFRILMRNDSFELYHGHLGNVFRTKYRDTDFPFSPNSVKKLHAMGFNAIIHGHRNITQGHRLTLKRGLLNFECDTSLDRKTRKIEGLKGYGASWLTIYPKGIVEAYSTDYPILKIFDVKKLGGKIVKNLPTSKSEKPTVEKFMKKAKLTVEVEENKAQLQQILQSLGEDIADGVLRIEGKDDKLVVQLPELMRLLVKGETTADQGEISFTISWGKKKESKKESKKTTKK